MSHGNPVTNPYAPPAAAAPPGPAGPARPGGPPSVDRGPNPFLHLGQLFFRPESFFRSPWALSGRWPLTLALLFCGAAVFLGFALLDDLKKSELGQFFQALCGDTFGVFVLQLLFWLTLGYLGYEMGGTWCQVLLRLCGAGRVEHREAKLIFLYSGLVAKIPLACFWHLFLGSPWSRVVLTREGSIGTVVLASVLVAWSHYTTYVGVRTRWNVNKLLAFLAFVILPMMFWSFWTGMMMLKAFHP